jgi:hypothetical protein
MTTSNRRLRAGVLCLVATALAACNSNPYLAPDPPRSGSGSSSSGAVPMTFDTSPVTLAARPPPPLSGGTMLLASDGVTAVAADPDRDTVWWTNLSGKGPVKSVALDVGDEPGRVVQDGTGIVHVALRGAGAIVAIDLAAGKIVRRTPVCGAPRGLAYDAATQAIHVACVGGDLVTVAAAAYTVQRTLQLEPDLRDVVVLGGGYLAVSTFRHAEILLLDATGAIVSRTRPLSAVSTEPVVAWRMIPLPGTTGVVVAHELATTQPVSLDQPPGQHGYSSPGAPGGSVAIVTSAVGVAKFDLTSPAQASKAPVMTSPRVFGALPVDLAVGPDQSLMVAVYGSGQVFSTALDSAGSLFGANVAATSIAIDAKGRFIVFTREPASFIVAGGKYDQIVIPLAAPSVLDTGHELFHRAPTGGAELACASCHPEGRDDGHVWRFDPIGLRRTPSLVGHLLATAPFHWDGSLPDVNAVMHEVFTRRMGGPIEDDAHVAAVSRFLDAIGRVPVSKPAPSVSLDRGKTLFESPDLGCTGCHSGPHFTNNVTVNVGTGAAFQVPTLIGVGLRAPYLHDGCAATLGERFGSCGGGDAHGHTSQLTLGEVRDLAAYLSSL